MYVYGNNVLGIHFCHQCLRKMDFTQFSFRSCCKTHYCVPCSQRSSWQCVYNVPLSPKSETLASCLSRVSHMYVCILSTYPDSDRVLCITSRRMGSRYRLVTNITATEYNHAGTSSVQSRLLVNYIHVSHATGRVAPGYRAKTMQREGIPDEVNPDNLTLMF